MDKKRKENKGEKKAYYVENCHPAIISKEDFEKAEQELRRRSIHKNKSNKTVNTKYALSDILVCAECGSPYRRVTWKGQYDETRYVWRCDNRLKNGKKYCKKSPTIDEAILHRTIMDCTTAIMEDNDIEKTVTENKNKIKQQKTSSQIDKQKQDFEKELEKYKIELDELITEELKGADVSQKYKELSQKINNVRNELEKHEEDRVDNLAIKTNIKLDRAFDESLVRQLVNKINIINKEEIEVEFISAIKVIKRLEY